MTRKQIEEHKLGNQIRACVLARAGRARIQMGRHSYFAARAVAQYFKKGDGKVIDV